MQSNWKDGEHIFRVDRFKVPAAARAEFLQRSQATHERLRAYPGFVEDFFLESPGDGGISHIVTIVIWKDRAAFEAARAAAQEHYRQTGFNPGETVKRLGIEADMLAYSELQS